MFDITALGELLIDYTPAGKSPSGMDLFEQNPGGAPANVLACATKLGLKTAFIGKIGADAQGDFLRKILEDAAINTDGLVSDENYFTTLAFVSLKENGERIFSFARKPGADTRLLKEDVNLSLIKSSRFFHFGSLSLTDSPARETTYFALEEAKKSQCIISYDPNYRPFLWRSREAAMEQMRAPLPYVDIIKLSDEETELITGHTDCRDAAMHLINNGIKIAAVTMGGNGVMIATKDGCEEIPGHAVNAVDTTGAGDAFWGAFLFSLRELEGRVEDITLPKAMQSAKFANAAAALCVTRRGAIPAMPQLIEVEALLRN